MCAAWIQRARRDPAASAVGAGAFALAVVGIRCTVASFLVVTVIDQPALLKTGGSHLIPKIKKKNVFGPNQILKVGLATMLGLLARRYW